MLRGSQTGWCSVSDSPAVVSMPRTLSGRDCSSSAGELLSVMQPGSTGLLYRRIWSTEKIKVEALPALLLLSRPAQEVPRFRHEENLGQAAAGLMISAFLVRGY